MVLVDLEEVKAALKFEDDYYDPSLELFIEGASRAVLNYLKVEETEYLSGAPEEVKIATIMLVGYFVNNPDSDQERYFANGYLPPAVVSLLYPLRDPAIA